MENVEDSNGKVCVVGIDKDFDMLIMMITYEIPPSKEKKKFIVFPMVNLRSQIYKAR